MAELIRNGALAADQWTLLRLPQKDEPPRKQAGKPVLSRLTGEQSATPEEIAALPIQRGRVIVPLAVWLARKSELTPRLTAGELGVWIDSHESPEAFAASVEDVNVFPLIAVNFPRFVDGRGYSIAALLRSRYGYRGELRALGDVLRDQLFYMKRCGFDAFALAPGKNAADALQGLRVFSESYQSAAEQPLPLYRRHARTVAA